MSDKLIALSADRYVVSFRRRIWRGMGGGGGGRAGGAGEGAGGRGGGGGGGCGGGREGGGKWSRDGALR